MKKLKLNLDDLKVESFETTKKNKNNKGAKGELNPRPLLP